MRRTTARRLVICCGLVIALAVAGAPRAAAEPQEPVCGWVTPPPPETTTTTETTTTQIPTTTTETTTTTTEPAVEAIWVCETETPTVSVVAVPTVPTETITPTTSPISAAPPPAVSSTSPTPRTSDAIAGSSTTRSSTSSVTPSTVPIAAPAKSAPMEAAASAAAGLLTISAGSPLIGPATIIPGQTWTGTMNLSVTNVSLFEGWVSTVSLSPLRGKNTGTVMTPTSATYSAPATSCIGILGTSDSVQVNLTPNPANAKRGIAVCLTAWTATVSVGVPVTGVVADTYEATLTHSIY